MPQTSTDDFLPSELNIYLYKSNMYTGKIL